MESRTAPEQLEVHLAPDDPRAALVRQVLASRTFAKSARLSQFFEFICRKCLEGASHEINEHQIGIHVFGRSPAYNPTDDSIVRTQARLLRQRLEEYFEHECQACSMIVLIPKGGYVPVFERRPEAGAHAELSVAQAPDVDVRPATSERVDSPGFASARHAAGAEAPATTPDHAASMLVTPQTARSASGRTVLWIAVTVACLGLAWALLSTLPHAAAPARQADLWASIFSQGRTVVIVPSDDGLVLSEEMRRAPVTLDEYLSGSYLQAPAAPGSLQPGAAVTAAWLSSHQYTSTADLNLAMRLNRLPEAAAAHVETRYARALRLDELKTSNVILIGGIGANPWVGLFSHILNFDVNYDWKTAQGYVINKSPMAGEQPAYREEPGANSARSYGVLAYLPGIAGNGSALLFEGSGMAGTEAAADFPFTGQEFVRFLAKLGRSPQGGMPYFEVLLATRSLAGNGPESEVLAWRVIHP